MSLLSFFGLGQSDIEDVFKKTIRTVSIIEKQLTKHHRDGVALAISTMLEVLEQGEVASAETKEKLLKMLKLWHKGGVLP